jgi:hypothetical protein
MNESAQLLSKPTNYAVVQLPGRKFPGVVVQGDSLHSLVQRLTEIQAIAAKHSDEELNAGLGELLEVLTRASRNYEAICNERGISLPYTTA